MLYGTMLIKVNKSFIKQLIMHFAGTGSKEGQCLLMLIRPLIYTY